VAQVSKLTSRQHPIVTRFRRLAAGRDGDRWILLDGEHLIAEALEAGVRVSTLLTDGRRSALVRRARDAGADVRQATTAVLEAASPVRTSSGVVAIAEWTPAPFAEIFRTSPALAVGLVAVQDPGNVGSIVRAADALGATGVLALEGTANPAGWKALRGSMGSLFRVPVATGSLASATAEARRAGLRVAATVATGGDPIDGANLAGPLLLLLGNEGAGLPDDVIAAADIKLTVPMRAEVNSLNVAVTAALVLFEARRQRQGARA
jgi:TrmH family RNA methyltransferase